VNLPEQLPWERLNIRERIILGLTVTFAVGAVIFYLYDLQQKRLLGLKSQLAGLTDEISSLAADLPLRKKALQEAAANKERAAREAAAAAQAQQRLAGGEGGFSALLDEIARMAREEDVEVVSVKLGDPRDQGGYVELPLTIEVASNFRMLGGYLHRLQHLPQLVVVGKVQLETSAQTSPILRVGVEAVSFRGKT
jgi:Tfp pilus assembly protein PilO